MKGAGVSSTYISLPYDSLKPVNSYHIYKYMHEHILYFYNCN